MKIVVYKGAGVDNQGLRALIASLECDVDLVNCSIALLDSDEILHTNWEQQTRLFIMPGGRDLPYVEKLSSQGTERIVRYVQQGGNYLGICAGAYFACAEIEFDKGGKLEVCGKRDLQFFSGVAVGPVYGRFEYGTTRGARAIRIATDQGELNVYFNGGCTFQSQDFSDCKVLGYYADHPQQLPAILHKKIDRGRVTLSGVHCEYPSSFLEVQDPYLDSIITSLKQTEQKRKAFFRSLLLDFDLPLKNP